MSPTSPSTSRKLFPRIVSSLELRKASYIVVTAWWNYPSGQWFSNGGMSLPRGLEGDESGDMRVNMTHLKILVDVKFKHYNINRTALLLWDCYEIEYKFQANFNDKN
jgi:hypothetical protein